MDAAASPENARALARYFKVAPGSYGEGDIFLGLKLGELRELAKPYVTSAFEPDQWLPMLHSPIHEHRHDRADGDERARHQERQEGSMPAELS